jgi:hypothetical protein
MTTARTLIKKAMLKAGILTKTEEPTADEANDALDSLNAMLSSWSNDSLLVYGRVLEPFTLSSVTAEYTIGTGLTFNTARPIFIADAFIRSGTNDYPVTVVTEEVYDSKQNKSTLGMPEFLTYTNGLPAKVKLYPTPSSNYTLYLLSEKELTQFTLDTTVTFPPGWERALIFNLAVEIASEYGQPVPVETSKIAASSKSSIKRDVNRTRTLDAQAPNGHSNNIYTGYFR